MTRTAMFKEAVLRSLIGLTTLVVVFAATDSAWWAIGAMVGVGIVVNAIRNPDLPPPRPA